MISFISDGNAREDDDLDPALAAPETRRRAARIREDPRARR